MSKKDKKRKVPVKEFTINYRRWGMGWMLNPIDDKLCCLGHLGLACGYEREELESFPTPSAVVGATERNLFPKWILYRDSGGKLDDFLMSVNDTNMDRALKMAIIEKTFKLKGIKLSWTNVPPTIKRRYAELMKNSSLYRKERKAALDDAGIFFPS